MTLLSCILSMRKPDFAEDVLRLTSAEERAHWNEKSLRNAQRFAPQRMIEQASSHSIAAWEHSYETAAHAAQSAASWSVRRQFLEKQFGYSLHPSSRIGLAWVFPERLVMEANSSIGDLTVCKQIALLHLHENATIGRGNWITGFPLGPSQHFAGETDRRPELIVGAHSAITHRHLIDCTNSITIGKFTTFAGFQSQMLTHSIDIQQNRQASAPSASEIIVSSERTQCCSGAAHYRISACLARSRF
ncbi:MAG: hypothetical protein WKF47_06320 [Geodermatophilaceae bacterium]